MKLLVTGGAGYVGSVCAAVLIERGHDVTVIDNFTTGNREAVPASATLVEGDVHDGLYGRPRQVHGHLLPEYVNDVAVVLELICPGEQKLSGFVS